MGSRRRGGTLVAFASLLVLAIAVWSAVAIATHRRGVPTDIESSRGGQHYTSSEDSGLSAAASEARLYSEILDVGDVAANDSVWYVLDARAVTVHMVHRDGTWLGAFGRQGDGPGEFSSPVAVAAFDGVVAVADEQRVHLHKPDGTYVGQRHVAPRGCALVRPLDIVGFGTTFFLLVECHSGPAAERLVLGDGHDELEALVRRRPAFGAEAIIDFGAVYVLSEHPAGFAFGNANDECLTIYDRNGAHVDRACHEGLERLPFPADTRRDLAAAFRSRRRSATVQLPDRLPPFDRVFADGERLVYRAFADADASRLVVQGATGEMEVLPIPNAPLLFVAGGGALAAWEDFEGTRIGWYGLGQKQ